VTRLAALAGLLLLVPAAPAHADGADPRPEVPTVRQLAQITPQLRGGEAMVTDGPDELVGATICRGPGRLPRPEAATTATYLPRNLARDRYAAVVVVRMASAADARRVLSLQARDTQCPAAQHIMDATGIELTDVSERAGRVGEQRAAWRLELELFDDDLTSSTVLVVARSGRTLVTVNLSGTTPPPLGEAFRMARVALRTGAAA
jgi:hypothetical protein